MAEIFSILTPVTYWILIVLWALILAFYYKHRKSSGDIGKAFAVLLLVLAIDAFRSLFESAFFGTWYTARVGMLPKEIFDFLVQPHIVFIPKILNVIVAVLVIGLLFRRLIPAILEERRRQEEQIHKLNTEIAVRKEVEEDLHRLIQELGQMNRDVPRYASIVSHDLRSPLVSIIGFGEIAKSNLDEARKQLDEIKQTLSDRQRAAIGKCLDDELAESLGYIASSSARMMHLVDTILDYSKAGQREMRPETIDMNALVKETLDALAFQIEEKGITVDVGPLPPVMADRTAMEQVVGNLLGNAVKFMSADGSREISVMAEREREYQVFRIRDTGRGIAEADIPHVFEVFKRVGKQDTEGEGMGLAYVQSLLRRMDGHIRCESALGEGSVFSFSLPVTATADANTHIMAEESAQVH